MSDRKFGWRHRDCCGRAGVATASGAAKLAARPGRLEIHPAGTRDSIPGRLEKATYVGSHLEFVVVCEFGEVFVVSDEVDSPLATGQEIGLKFAARGPVLIAD